MELEKKLRSVPADQWVTQQAIAFDWYDGPLEGVCSLARPTADFFFSQLDEIPTEDGLDMRLYRVKELPPGAVAAIAALLGCLGQPPGPLWAPTWQFPSAVAQQEVEEKLQSLLDQASATNLVIASPDMLHFFGCWNDNALPAVPVDWPSLLGFVSGPH